jgi:vacuolar-type H+-ATPase subunit H
MDKSILSEVIAVEKDVQRGIEQEEARLQSWLEQVRKEAADAVADELQNDGAEMQQVMTRARKDAEKRAETIRDEARSLAARMAGLDDAVLTGIIRKRLTRIFRE